MPIDILTGSSAAREWVDGLGAWDELEGLAATPAHWWQTVAPSLLYA